MSKESIDTKSSDNIQEANAMGDSGPSSLANSLSEITVVKPAGLWMKYSEQVKQL